MPQVPRVTGPELPRAVALLIAQAALPTPSGNLSLIEITDTVGTWQFPNSFPPFVIAAILVGGRPGVVYTTRFRVTDPHGEVIGERAGGDAPFTTQITRVNILERLDQLAPGPVIRWPGVYRFELSVNGAEVKETLLDVREVDNPLVLPSS